MSATLPVSTILSVAKISEYLAANNIPYTNYFRGAALDSRLANMIYMERSAVQNRFNLNPSDPTLIGTSNYLYAILGKFAIEGLNVFNSLSATAPEITGPTNQSVSAGSNATFTVSVVSSLPVIYQWFRDGVAIPGATAISYTLTNAQLSDSGALFSVSATNAAGTTNSVQATLTVTATLTGSFYYTDVDPGPALQASTDPFSYQSTFSIIHNAPLVITLPAPSTPNKYLVIRFPSSEPDRAFWSNTPSNSGTIPDSNFQSQLNFGGNKYVYTRQAVSMDTNQTLVLSPAAPAPPQDGATNYLFMIFDPAYVWDGVAGHAAVNTNGHTGLFFIYKNTAVNWKYSRLRITDSHGVLPDYLGAWKDTSAGTLIAQYVGNGIADYASRDTLKYDVSYDQVNFFTVEQQDLVLSDPGVETDMFGAMDGTNLGGNSAILGWGAAIGGPGPGEFNTGVKGSYLSDFWTINNAQSTAYKIANGTLQPTLATGTFVIDGSGLGNHLFSDVTIINVTTNNWTHSPGDVYTFNYNWSINNVDQIATALGNAFGVSTVKVFPVGSPGT